jgi:HJR/Mrr/RecB family endonuclease
MQLVPQDFELERQLEFVEAAIARLERQQDELFAEQRRQVRPAWTERQRRRYLRVAQRFRAPGARYELWSSGVILLLPAVAAVAFIVAHLTSASAGVGLIASAVAAVVGALIAAALLFIPSAARLSEARRKLDAEHERSAALEQAIQATNEHRRKYVVERDSLRATARGRRIQLLKRDWRALRGQDWVDYVAEMLLALGAVVQVARREENPAIDLVAEFGPRRVAIQTNSSTDALTEAAVRALLAAQDKHRCHAAALVTNGRFQAAAKRLAGERQCLLIGVDNFERFALGELRL